MERRRKIGWLVGLVLSGLQQKVLKHQREAKLDWTKMYRFQLLALILPKVKTFQITIGESRCREDEHIYNSYCKLLEHRGYSKFLGQTKTITKKYHI